MGFGIGDFIGQATGMNSGAAAQGQQASDSMMNDLMGTSQMQMKMQSEQGLMNMMVKLNEALAKLFKAIGDAIKGLVG
jgi:hypothetical protein